MKNILLTMAITLIAAAGCDEARPIEELGYAERQALIEEKIEACVAQGVARNSPQMEVCALVELEAESARRQDMRRRFQALGQGMQQVGQSYQNAAARQTNCTTQAPMPGTWSRTYTTTCY